MDLLITTILKRPQPYQDVDDASLLAVLQADQEEYLLAMAFPAPALNSWNAVNFLDENEAANLPTSNFYREQEEPHFSQLLATQSIPWLAVPFLDDEIIARGPNNVGDDEAYVARWMPPVWTAVVFGDEDPVQIFAAQDEMQDPSPAAQQVQQNPWTVFLPSVDDETKVQPALGVDDETTILTTGGLLSTPYAKPPFLATDDEITGFFSLDQQDYPATPVQAVWLPPVPALAFADEDAGASLSHFALEQEDFFVGAIQSVPWLAFVVLDAADQGSMRVSGLDQEEYNYGLAVQVWSVAFAQFTPSDSGESTQLIYFTLEDESGSFPAVQRIDWTALPARDDEVGARLAGFALEQEEPYIAVVQVIPWGGNAFLDDEILSGAKFFALDQEEPSVPQSQTIAWLAVSPAYDETSAGLVSFALEDERAYDGAVQQTVWVSRPALDDEIYPRFGLDDEQPYTPQVQLIPWRPAPFLDDEVGAFIPYDDDPPYVAAVQQVLWNCIAFLDDEIMVITTAVAPSRRLRIIGWDSTTFTITGDGT